MAMIVPTCEQELKSLYDVIMRLQKGEAVVSISFGERSVSYSQTQLASLLTTYRVFHAQCGASLGLPDLSPHNAVRRGPPARFRAGF